MSETKPDALDELLTGEKPAEQSPGPETPPEPKKATKAPADPPSRPKAEKPTDDGFEMLNHPKLSNHPVPVKKIHVADALKQGFTRIK
jgi:hypothetical protein